MPETSPSTTPKFDKPPVVETVIGVQFPELAGFRTPHFGLYWQTIQSEYQKVEDRPRLDEAVELFPRNIVPKHGFRISGRVLPDRVWYTAQSGSELIQLQPNRFLFNWRRQEPTDSYQSYEKSSSKFLGEFENFCRFCHQQELEAPKPNLCEVTYVNHIMPEGDESAIDLFATTFTGLAWELSDERLPPPESTTFNRVYVIEKGGRKVGRLYAEASIAILQEDQGRREFVRLHMTGRVNHPAEGKVALADSLRLAHDWVVNGFASMSHPEIQKKRWGRTV
jgi:uncharacterized protein (TIGR04255 family)